ncbi:hypothetical protein PHOBOS_217 [Erwinia phage vB_EamM_Phobos]|uniref:hypothetical protein n=1 Tax=Erwinia phage vB_EamM_Phobos TaxID=1883377 RepID=UPI00081C7B34|nr:hypothetical protein BIZ79_gp217 [Erwinia phage vB_EamM_Phobos]ANZ50407.1 hypothetical protein PHOBOS_217 [Erwinia phage vB_EamM_Phobos]
MNKLALDDTGVVINDKPVGNLNLDRWVHHELEELFGNREFYITLVSEAPTTEGWLNRMPLMRDVTEDVFVSVYRAATIRGWVIHTESAANLSQLAQKAVPFAAGKVPAGADDLLLWVDFDPQTKQTKYAIVY